MHVIFLTGIPGHWCYVPEIAESNLSLEMQKALIMPPSDPHCSMYDVNYTDILQSRNPKFNNETPTKPCDKGWFYENSEFDQTAVTEWDLVCKDDHYVNLLLSTTFMGIFLGSQLFSSLSSKIGRKPTFLISALIITVSDVGSSVSRNFVMVVLLRILQGTAISSIYSTPYALILEIVRPELRTLMNEIATVSWTAGLCLLPMIAWVSRSWVIMSGLNSSCALVLFLCGSVIPESPMWLVTQGQYRKANDILKKMSKLNGKTAHQDYRLLERVRNFGHEYQRNVADQKKCSARDFFKYPRLRRRFMCIAMCWMLNTIPYAGLQMNTRFLEGNKFVNFFLASLVEIPAHFGTWFCIVNSGRRWTLLTAFIIAAISCFLTFPLDGKRHLDSEQNFRSKRTNKLEGKIVIRVKKTDEFNCEKDRW
ncbi:organic cation transporter 1 [Trichonephila clavata]|uniref:Organic cation transporter 1 n=1 Tax=Trichonephila clavata TaxID=2740835 RepID=A0A8X6GWT2_TRICU|nr:organic cation transporter 1 [Trichonephila clavata]